MPHALTRYRCLRDVVGTLGVSSVSVAFDAHQTLAANCDAVESVSPALTAWSQTRTQHIEPRHGGRNAANTTSGTASE
jgi:hypothetical protein